MQKEVILLLTESELNSWLSKCSIGLSTDSYQPRLQVRAVGGLLPFGKVTGSHWPRGSLLYTASVAFDPHP